MTAIQILYEEYKKALHSDIEPQTIESFENNWDARYCLKAMETYKSQSLNKMEDEYIKSSTQNKYTCKVCGSFFENHIDLYDHYDNTHNRNDTII